MQLHPIQQKLLAIAQEQDLESLTLRELAHLVGISHPQQVKHHKEQLQKKGLLAVSQKPQVLPIIDTLQKAIQIPILGAANCGLPLLSAVESERGFLSLSPTLLPKSSEVFALVARGNSMNVATIGSKQKHINDGDYVLIDASKKQPNNGDYVLSVINGAANIKRFYKKDDFIVLKSESTEEFPPIILDPQSGAEYFVNGQVFDVINL